ncbi:LPXTG cell wall anchor domain-containing protein [Streptomyces sp. NPDC001339]|uniref:LPXTG cell wall anchor domain-containing protein n=1 Tax=Streptomyces sp. NPDC001339 TaxID=3364563 RepID=UPI003689A83A
MKFRQALTAAATMAAIAPAAVLAAPAAAFATEAPSPSAHTHESQTDGATGPGESSGAAGPATETDGGAKSGAENGAKPAPDAKPDEESGTKPDRETGSKVDKESGAKADKETGTKPDSTSESTPDGSASEERPPGGDCASAPKYLRMAIKGLQSEFIAGADWSLSSITVTNTSDKAMEKVRPQPYISSAEIVDRPYEELEAQFRNPATGKWLSFEDATIDSEFTGFPVAAHSTVTLPLRVRAIDPAKPGHGYAIMEGMFANQDGSCGFSNHEQYDFKILPARGKPERPSRPVDPHESAEVGGGAKGGSTPQRHLTAQGGAKVTSAEAEGRGHLAATGASSALPAIALVGGVAMAVGAGAVITVRRRKTAAGSGEGTGAAA